MKKLCRLVAMVGIGLCAVAASANAQVIIGDDQDGDDCLASLIIGGEGERVVDIDVCGAAYSSRVSAIRITGTVQNVIGRSFGFGPSTMQPAGLSGLLADDAQSRLAPSTFVITPTSSDAGQEPALTRRLNVWADGRGLYTDYIKSAGDLDGPTTSLLAGFDYKLNSKLSAGLLFSAESSQLESAVNNLDSTSLGVGPYVGLMTCHRPCCSANGSI